MNISPADTYASQFAMVSLRRLLLDLLPLLELLRIGERDAVDALQAFPVGLALPVGRRILQTKRKEIQPSQNQSPRPQTQNLVQLSQLRQQGTGRATHSVLALKLLFLAVLELGALLSSNLEEALYKFM